MVCFLNATLGVNVVMALTYLVVGPFSAATARRLVSDGSFEQLAKPEAQRTRGKRSGMETRLLSL